MTGTASTRPAGRRVRSARRPNSAGRALALVPLAALGITLGGCGSSLNGIVGSTSTVPSTATSAGADTSTATPSAGSVAVAFPVIACTSSSGSPLSTQGWKPSILLGPIPTALVSKVEFYSDGVHTVLAPVGWSCAQTPTDQGTSGLVVYPPGNPDPAVNPTAAGTGTTAPYDSGPATTYSTAATTPPPAGTEGIFATFASTGTVPGIAMVCPFFTIPQWQQREANCPSSKPQGEQTSLPTPDVVSITDPAGVTGTLDGSGGAQPVTGAVIFPQVVPAVTQGSTVDVAEVSCSLVASNLCPTIISDFEVREFPVPVSER